MFWIWVAVFAVSMFVAVYVATRGMWQAGGREGVRAVEEMGLLETLSPFIAFFKPLGRQSLYKMSAKDIRELDERLLDAGLRRELSLEEFVSLRYVGASIGVVAGGLAFAALVGLKPMVGLGAVVFGLMGWVYPSMWLKNQARRRKERIFRGLSHTLDVLSISVQAGLEVREALERVVRIGGEPELDTELNRTLQEISKGGKSLSEAFQDLQERINVPEVTAFCNVVLMAFQLGASGVGDLLAEQANAIRTERVLRAERVTSEMPSKILFPIAVFIFPAVLVTILGPLGLRAYLEFGGP